VGEFSHIGSQGRGRMVNVSEKPETYRLARAAAAIVMKEETVKKIKEAKIGKGDVLGVAQTAGIMAAKQTWQMIPMCHPLMLTGVDLRFIFLEDGRTIEVESEVQVTGRTGVEMEALTAVSVAALTVYDMCKAVDREIVITDIRLLEKRGGKSGVYRRQE
jgi:cyclic pyranopterin phosphate synthase